MKCLCCHRKITRRMRLSDLLYFSDLELFPRCQFCEESLCFLEQKPHCPRCCRLQDHEEICEDCIRWQKIYPHRKYKNRSLCKYEGLAQEWLQAFKYQGDYRLLPFFRQDLQRLIENYYFNYLLVPIPVSQTSLQKRGFNQVAVLLEDAGLSYIDLLENKQGSQRQAEKGRKARMTSPQAFCLKKRAEISDRSRPILLVDDVYTTGRTLMHAYDCLEGLTESRIESLTLFR